jgi:hypothetical protein
VIRPELVAGAIEITTPISAGHDLPFPPLRFMEGERRIEGKVELRVTDAEGSPGDEVTARVELRAERPVNWVPFLLWFDSGSLLVKQVVPLYPDSEDGIVNREDYVILPGNGNPPMERLGQIDFRYQIQRKAYREPPIAGNPSLEYLIPLGEWIDLAEVHFTIREAAAGRGETPLQVSRYHDYYPPTPSFLPYSESWDVEDVDCPAEPEGWSQETEYHPGRVVILGGGEPREPEPPLDPELANIRFELGDAEARPGDLVRIPVRAQSAVDLHLLRFVLGFDRSRLGLEGFEVNIVDPDGNPGTVDLLPLSEVDTFGNGPVCDRTGPGIFDVVCRYGYPYEGTLYGYSESHPASVPSGVVIVDLRKNYSLSRQPVPPPAEVLWWSAGTVYEIGAVLLRVRDDAPEGPTRIGGVEAEWQPWGYLLPVRSRSAGYPILEEPNPVRNDVPAMVDPGTLVIRGKSFLRADGNGDGKVDLSDSVGTLEALFQGGRPPGCLDAADSNDDGQVDISDPVHTLLYLFLGGPAPPPPFPKSGADPTVDALGCRA